MTLQEAINYPTWTKRIEWSYYTSDNAKRFGFNDPKRNPGCYTLSLVNPQGIPHAAAGFATLTEAVRTAAALPNAWDTCTRKFEAEPFSGCWMVDQVEFAGEGHDCDRDRAKAYAAFCNLPVEEQTLQRFEQLPEVKGLRERLAVLASQTALAGQFGPMPEES